MNSKPVFQVPLAIALGLFLGIGAGSGFVQAYGGPGGGGGHGGGGGGHSGGGGGHSSGGGSRGGFSSGGGSRPSGGSGHSYSGGGYGGRSVPSGNYSATGSGRTSAPGNFGSAGSGRPSNPGSIPPSGNGIRTTSPGSFTSSIPGSVGSPGTGQGRNSPFTPGTINGAGATNNSPFTPGTLNGAGASHNSPFTSGSINSLNNNGNIHTSGYRGIGNGNQPGGPGGINQTGFNRGNGSNINGANRFPGEYNFAHGGGFQRGGHNVQAYSRGNMVNHCNNIRRNFYGGGFYNSGWYGNYFSPWWPGIWYGGGLWTGLSYGGLCNWCSLDPFGYSYNYGNNVIYSGGQVLVNGDSVGTPSQYYQQAADLAANGEQAKIPPKEEWQALGLFALSKEQEKESTNLLQLAISRDGVVRGTYYNSVLNQTLPINGSLDKKTQRVAWTVGENKETVYEAGLKNLTLDQATCLVHYNDRRTEQMFLTRMKEPEKSAPPENNK